MPRNQEPPSLAGWSGVLVALLRRLRGHEGDGPSLSQLAARSGYSRNYLSQVFRGLRRPRSDAVEAIVTALGGTADDVRLARTIADHLRNADEPDDRRPYLITTHPRRRPPRPPPDDHEVGRLIDSRLAVVPFVGRSSELEDLVAWRDGESLAVRLLHGAAGAGKTRLCMELAGRSTVERWTVLDAYHRTDPARPSRSRSTTVPTMPSGRTGRAGRRLVIVDDADRWPLPDITDLVEDLTSVAAPKLRILLVTRSAAHRWTVLRRRLDKAHVLTDEQHLTADTIEARAQMLTAARESYAAALGMRSADLPPEGCVGETALDINLAALAAVDGNRRHRGPAVVDANLTASLIDREYEYWEARHRADGKSRSTPAQTMGQAVFVAALTGACPYPDGLAVITRVELPNPEQVLDDHRVCYPPVDAATILQPLSPHRLAEDYIVTYAERSPEYRALTNPKTTEWAHTAVLRLLALPDGNSPGYLARATSVLTDAARRSPRIAQWLSDDAEHGRGG